MYICVLLYFCILYQYVYIYVYIIYVLMYVFMHVFEFHGIIRPGIVLPAILWYSRPPRKVRTTDRCAEPNALGTRRLYSGPFEDTGDGSIRYLVNRVLVHLPPKDPDFLLHRYIK